jgi:FkbM family methyltransferase
MKDHLLEIVRRTATHPMLLGFYPSWLGQRLRPFMRLAARVAEKATSAAHPSGYPIQVGNGTIIVDPAFILARKLGEELLLEEMLTRLSPGDVVLDVGSWAGIYALRAAQIVGPGGKVFAFEPAPDTHRLLEKHVHLNHQLAVIETIPMACGDRLGKLMMDYRPFCSENRLILNMKPSDLARKMVEIEVTTIDHFCTQRGLSPQLIKIDVEGAEFLVLSGAREVLAQRRPIVLCELHPRLWPAFGTTKTQIWELAVALDYHLQELGVRPGTSIEYISLTPCKNAD